MAQVLRGTPATISATWFVDGDIADPGVVTIDIIRGDGTLIVDDGATLGTGAAARTFNLTAVDHTNLIDNLTAVWTSPSLGEITTFVTIVSDVLFTESEARAFDGGALSNTTTYPDADIIFYRDMISDAFMNRLNVPFGQRYRREVIDGNGHDTIMIPGMKISALRSVEERERGTQTWTAFDTEALADVLFESWGRLIRETLSTWTWGFQNFRIGYEYGFERVPAEINRAGLLVLRDQIVKSNIDDRATSFTDEFGSRTFVVQAGIRGALYSIPEVNAILNEREYNLRVPVVG